MCMHMQVALGVTLLSVTVTPGNEATVTCDLVVYAVGQVNHYR